MEIKDSYNRREAASIGPEMCRELPAAKKPPAADDLLQMLLETVSRIIQASESGNWQPGDGDEEETVADARELHGLCGRAKGALEAGETDRIASLFLQAGMVVERVGVRPFEPYVAVGRKLLDRRNKGGAPRKETPPEGQLQREVDELTEQGIEGTEAHRRVGLRHRISASTVRRRIS